MASAQSSMMEQPEVDRLFYQATSRPTSELVKAIDEHAPIIVAHTNGYHALEWGGEHGETGLARPLAYAALVGALCLKAESGDKDALRGFKARRRQIGVGVLHSLAMDSLTKALQEPVPGAGRALTVYLATHVINPYSRLRLKDALQNKVHLFNIFNSHTITTVDKRPIEKAHFLQDSLANINEKAIIKGCEDALRTSLIRDYPQITEAYVRTVPQLASYANWALIDRSDSALPERSPVGEKVARVYLENFVDTTYAALAARGKRVRTEDVFEEGLMGAFSSAYAIVGGPEKRHRSILETVEEQDSIKIRRKILKASKTGGQEGAVAVRGEDGAIAGRGPELSVDQIMGDIWMTALGIYENCVEIKEGKLRDAAELAAREQELKRVLYAKFREAVQRKPQIDPQNVKRMKAAALEFREMISSPGSLGVRLNEAAAETTSGDTQRLPHRLALSAAVSLFRHSGDSRLKGKSAQIVEAGLRGRSEGWLPEEAEVLVVHLWSDETWGELGGFTPAEVSGTGLRSVGLGDDHKAFLYHVAADAVNFSDQSLMPAPKVSGFMPGSRRESQARADRHGIQVERIKDRLYNDAVATFDHLKQATPEAMGLLIECRLAQLYDFDNAPPHVKEALKRRMRAYMSGKDVKKVAGQLPSSAVEVYQKVVGYKG